MGDCGHSACANCWSEWLKRSKTCPVCRQKTDKENLSRMIFERRVNSGALSFTQMCASDDDASADDASAEDELEVMPPT